MIKEHKLTIEVTLFSEKETDNLGSLLGRGLTNTIEGYLLDNNLNRYLYSDIKWTLENKK